MRARTKNEGTREGRAAKPRETWAEPEQSPNLSSIFATNLHNFIFLLAVCGSYQRRTTALGLVLLFSLDIMKTFSRDYSVTGVQSQDPKAHENRKF